MLDLAPDNIEIVRLPGGNLAITFTFPEAYIDSFDWGASSTESLGTFIPVTTSTVTVPLVTALGVGLATIIRGRNPLVDGFGLIAFASLFPMMFVMGYGMIIFN